MALTSSLFALSEDALNQILPPGFLTYRNCKAQLHEVLLKYYSKEYFKTVALKCHIIIPSCLGSTCQPSWGIYLTCVIGKKKKKKKKMNGATAQNFIHRYLGHCLASIFLQSLLCVCLPWPPVISKNTPLSCSDPTTLLSPPSQTLLL